MSGSIPNTAYLLISNDRVVGEFETLPHITRYLGISIDNDGLITFMGDKVNPQYSLECWTKANAVQDWSKCYMLKNLPSGYKIGWYLT